MRACHQAKYNVMLLKSKDFRDLNQPGSNEQPLNAPFLYTLYFGFYQGW